MMSRSGHTCTWLIAIAASLWCVTLLRTTRAADANSEDAATSRTSEVAPSPSDATALPVLKPVRTFTMPYDGEFVDVVANHDGSKLYGKHVYRSINVWGLIVYCWPELMLMIAGLLSLLVLRRLVRAVRRRHAVGEPHCRKCQYQLTGITTELCPECGADLQRPRAVHIRRSATRRICVAVALLVFIVGGAAMTYFGNPSRYSKAEYWFNWQSTAVYTWVNRHGLFSEYGMYHEIIEYVEVDSDSGHVSRVIAGMHSSNGPRAFRQTQLSPDARFLVFRTDQRRVSAWDASTQQQIAPPGQDAIDAVDDILLSKDGDTVYCMQGLNKVSTWHLLTNRWTDDDDVEIVRQQTTATNPDDPPFAYVWDIAESHRRVHIFPDDGRVFQHQAPADHRAMILTRDENDFSAIAEWDLDAQRQLATFGRPAAMAVIEWAQVSGDGNTLVAAGVASQRNPTSPQVYPGIVMVLDRNSRAWTRILDTSSLTKVNELILSHDGRRILVTGSDLPKQNGANRVLVFELHDDDPRRTASTSEQRP